MNLVFLTTINILLLLIPNAAYASTEGINTNLVYDFVASNANFSADPCDDFAAHVCPEGGDSFLRHVLMEYDKIWMIQEKNGHRLKHIWQSNNDAHQIGADVREMIRFMTGDSGLIERICSHNRAGNAAVYNIAKLLDSIRGFSQITPKSTCRERVLFIHAYSVHKNTYNTIIRGAVGIAVHEYIQNKTERFHQLFFDIKNEFIELLKVTPWVKNKDVISNYIDKLNQVTINDLGTIAKPLEEAIVEYDRSYKLCTMSLRSIYTTTVIRILCRISSIHIASEIIYKNEYIDYDTFSESATDSVGNIYNTDDGTIFFGNPAELLVYSDMVPAFYGVLGFLMSHELMHSFVFDDADVSELKNFWTEEYQCITEQTFDTCQNFGANCGDPDETFEEDAADFNGIRLAWQVYQKQKKAVIEKTGRFAVQRKKTLKNPLEITDDQLFFYAAATFLCDGSTRHSSPNAHSLGYVRINNFASQMDQFQEAFNCKDDDMMIRNKLVNCVQYGSDAPLQRKTAMEN